MRYCEQGVLDPLNDALGRARQLKQACGELAEVVELQAGHCPHDEVPEQVNAALLEWVQRVVLPRCVDTEKQDVDAPTTLSALGGAM
jgi:hypothetical protein